MRRTILLFGLLGTLSGVPHSDARQSAERSRPVEPVAIFWRPYSPRVCEPPTLRLSPATSPGCERIRTGDHIDIYTTDPTGKPVIIARAVHVLDVDSDRNGVGLVFVLSIRPDELATLRNWQMKRANIQVAHTDP